MDADCWLRYLAALLSLLALSNAAISGPQPSSAASATQAAVDDKPLADGPGSCPDKCTCKYARNKKTVECVNGNYSNVPKLDSDTQVLDLSQNPLPILPARIFAKSGLINLQRIYLSKCQMRDVPSDLFASLSNLVELDLSYNFLRDVPSDSFAHCQKMRKLLLNGNPIRRLTNSSFGSLSSLQMLDLSGCGIELIEPDAFVGLQGLRSLHLNGNKLSALSGAAVRALPQVQELNLQGNLWYCDCRLRELREYMLEHNIPLSYPPSCHQPQALSGRSWADLDLNSFLCAPRILPNNSDSVIRVEEFRSLVLSCSFYMDEGTNLMAPVRWYWEDRPIGNNSEGVVPTQTFSISELELPLFANSTEKKMMKLSRLEISLVLELNHGHYGCISTNAAGSASSNFTVLVTKQKSLSANGGHNSLGLGPTKPGEQASSIVTGTQRSEPPPADGHGGEHEVMEDDDDPLGRAHRQGEGEVIAGLVLGILFGAFLVLALFGLTVIIVCRRRHGRAFGASGDRVAAESELEKLTPSTTLVNSSLSSHHSGCGGVGGMFVEPGTTTVALINPIRKPPRLDIVEGTPTVDTPQIWMMGTMKRNIGMDGSFRSDGDGEAYAECTICS